MEASASTSTFQQLRSNRHDDSANTSTRMKLDGLAVTMDGREAEADVDVNMQDTTGKTSEEQQDAAAQDLNERRQSQLKKQNKFTKTSVLIPPENFAIVEDGLYRSVSLAKNGIVSQTGQFSNGELIHYPYRANLQNSTFHSCKALACEVLFG